MFPRNDQKNRLAKSSNKPQQHVKRPTDRTEQYRRNRGEDWVSPRMLGNKIWNGVLLWTSECGILVKFFSLEEGAFLTFMLSCILYEIIFSNKIIKLCRLH